MGFNGHLTDLSKNEEMDSQLVIVVGPATKLVELECSMVDSKRSRSLESRPRMQRWRVSITASRGVRVFKEVMGG